MKTRLIVMWMTVCFATTCFAKDIKTIVLNTTPQMHCANCENRIKSNIRFEKGIKEIETNLKDKTVTIKYDADKTTIEKIIAGFAKIDYVATVVKDGVKQCDKQNAEGENCSKQEKDK